MEEKIETKKGSIKFSRYTHKHGRDPYLINKQTLASSLQSFYDIRGLRCRATGVLGTKPACVSTKR